MANVNEELGVHIKQKTPGNIISVKTEKEASKLSRNTEQYEENV